MRIAEARDGATQEEPHREGGDDGHDDPGVEPRHRVGQEASESSGAGHLCRLRLGIAIAEEALLVDEELGCVDGDVVEEQGRDHLVHPETGLQPAGDRTPRTTTGEACDECEDEGERSWEVLRRKRHRDGRASAHEDLPLAADAHEAGGVGEDEAQRDEQHGCGLVQRVADGERRAERALD